MNIHGLTVCVNYSDFLRLSIGRWMKHLKSLTIVTSPSDLETPKLAEEYGARLFVTNSFYADGAKFNKGRAMEEARLAMPEWEDWFLFFDADVVPEEDWFIRLWGANLAPGKLYGAYRYQCDNAANLDWRLWPRIPDALCDGGYFHLFHTSDPRAGAGVQERPLLETCWAHCGVYDSHFSQRWDPELRALSPVRLAHVGERENWTGRGDKEGMRALLNERVRRRGYQHERIGQ